MAQAIQVIVCLVVVMRVVVLCLEGNLAYQGRVGKIV